MNFRKSPNWANLVSQPLGVLQENGLLTFRKDGKRSLYHINRDHPSSSECQGGRQIASRRTRTGRPQSQACARATSEQGHMFNQVAGRFDQNTVPAVPGRPSANCSCNLYLRLISRILVPVRVWSANCSPAIRRVIALITPNTSWITASAKQRKTASRTSSSVMATSKTSPPSQDSGCGSVQLNLTSRRAPRSGTGLSLPNSAFGRTFDHFGSARTSIQTGGI